ncbi:hypothetical protein [Pusillimonas sp. MFBS29]|uniref:hypothetical protein n=1 Tax=Pusillimonas sp. MFBS29 TaxID=2886690 RepID=UPI00351D5C08
MQDLVRIQTNTPLGENAPHADAVATALEQLGWAVERHAVPATRVSDYGMQPITNLIARRRYSNNGPAIARNAQGDVVPPGDGWTCRPYDAVIENGCLYGRAATVSRIGVLLFDHGGWIKFRTCIPM